MIFPSKSVSSIKKVYYEIIMVTVTTRTFHDNMKPCDLFGLDKITNSYLSQKRKKRQVKRFHRQIDIIDDGQIDIDNRDLEIYHDHVFILFMIPMFFILFMLI